MSWCLSAAVLPDKLNIDATLTSKVRKRSLYEAQVYSGEVSISGTFTRPNMAFLSHNIEKIHWEKAWLAFGQ